MRRLICLSLWIAFFLSSAVQAEGRNSFLPTRNHNPEGQQLGVYFVPWTATGPFVAVRFFLTKGKTEGRLLTETAFIDDAGTALWREEISGAIDTAFWGETSLSGKRVKIDFADDGATLIALKKIPKWAENPQLKRNARLQWHVPPTDKNTGAQLMIYAPPPSLEERKANWRVRRGILAGAHSRVYGWVVIRQLDTAQPVSALVWQAGEGVAWAQMNHKGDIDLDYLKALGSQSRRQSYKGGVPEKDPKKWQNVRYDLLDVRQNDKCTVPATMVISGFEDKSGYQAKEDIFTRCRKDSIYGRMSLERMWGDYQKVMTHGLWVQF